MSGSRRGLAWDVIVVGGGHAGIEAALACRRLECSALLVTGRCARIGEMSCNPAIGGIAKGALVREVDCLGGSMGEAADRTRLHFRMLNRSKGRSVWGPRAQVDAEAYARMQAGALAREGVTVLEDEVVALHGPVGGVDGIVCARAGAVTGAAVVLATGTFLGGRLFRGEETWAGGRFGDFSAMALESDLRARRFHVKRFKTGTSPRVLRESIRFDRMARQPGEGEYSFSFGRAGPDRGSEPCWVTRTSRDTRRVALDALDRSPLFCGKIEGKGPRYCPSFEDKAVRFAEKEEHIVFVEPMGAGSQAMYLNGLSTSLPLDAQQAMLATIPGLEEARILQPGYAVEYTLLDPEEFDACMLVRKEPKLLVAGQVCGTSGYEEAAGLGVLAGLNAGRIARGEHPVQLERSESYIGVMADDLSSRSWCEPYRLFSSRAENRMHLREENADRRMVPVAMSWGLARGEDVRRVDRLERDISRIRALLEGTRKGVAGTQLCRRPSTGRAELLGVWPELAQEDVRAVEAILLDERYSGYIDRALRRIDQRRQLESVSLESVADFSCIEEICIEAREILGRMRPRTLGEAASLAGVRPSDLDGLLLHLGRGCST
ncbi:tRNA uridine-5-carboxymethylaminomethyl(34) synthesis enzyme MnmG [Candidatus Fermentibacterales bacterium]|nr:tRNA uridine-5-carboxymethylaminomethyl(34) synthesis enzyme MnmG [Candidatus Fermentibacterales bacterium]